jgi:hypothetical protein
MCLNIPPQCYASILGLNSRQVEGLYLRAKAVLRLISF